MNIRYAGAAKYVKQAIKTSQFKLPILERARKFSWGLVGVESTRDAPGKDIMIRVQGEVGIIQAEGRITAHKQTEEFVQAVRTLFPNQEPVFQTQPYGGVICTTCGQNRPMYLEYAQVEPNSMIEVGKIRRIIVGEKFEAIYAGAVDLITEHTGIVIFTPEGVSIKAQPHSKEYVFGMSFVAEGVPRI